MEIDPPFSLRKKKNCIKQNQELKKKNSGALQ